MAFTTVKGTVTRTFHEGKGAEITEEFKVKGEPIKKRWSVWFEAEHGLEVGQTVEITGLHSDKVDAWETKEGETRHSVNRAINRAQIKAGKDPAPQTAPEAAQTASEWTGEVPF